MSTNLHTQEKIILAALHNFLARGIKKSSMMEIAEQAGVTRITAYRYFEDKESLVRAAFLRMVVVFQQAHSIMAANQDQNIEAILDSIGIGLAALPQGDLPTRLEELNLLYPDIAEEFHTTRLETINAIFSQLFTAARQQGKLNEGIQQEVVEVIFMEAAAHALQSPRLTELGLSSTEIFSNLKNIFLQGLLK